MQVIQLIRWLGDRQSLLERTWLNTVELGRATGTAPGRVGQGSIQPVAKSPALTEH